MGGKNQVNLILSHYSPTFCEISPSLSASQFCFLDSTGTWGGIARANQSPYCVLAHPLRPINPEQYSVYYVYWIFFSCDLESESLPSSSKILDIIPGATLIISADEPPLLPTASHKIVSFSFALNFLPS